MKEGFIKTAEDMKLEGAIVQQELQQGMGNAYDQKRLYMCTKFYNE